MTIETEKYNGWTNRETWAMALHIDNDEGFQNEVYELAENHTELYEFEKALQDFVEEIVDTFFSHPDLQNHGTGLMIQDIGSMWRVNWREIAEHYHAGRGE